MWEDTLLLPSLEEFRKDTDGLSGILETTRQDLAITLPEHQYSVPAEFFKKFLNSSVYKIMIQNLEYRDYIKELIWRGDIVELYIISKKYFSPLFADIGEFRENFEVFLESMLLLISEMIANNTKDMIFLYENGIDDDFHNTLKKSFLMRYLKLEFFYNYKDSYIELIIDYFDTGNEDSLGEFLEFFKKSFHNNNISIKENIMKVLTIFIWSGIVEKKWLQIDESWF